MKTIVIAVLAILAASSAHGQHAIAEAFSGIGTPASPYHAEWIEGEGGEARIRTCMVTGAGGSLATATLLSGPGAFSFLVDSTGGLATFPSRVLSSGDVGLHEYLVEISKPGGPVKVRVDLLVRSAAPGVAWTLLPDGTEGQPYGPEVAGPVGGGPWTQVRHAGGMLPPGLVSTAGSGGAIVQGTCPSMTSGLWRARFVASDALGRGSVGWIDVWVHWGTNSPPGAGGSPGPIGGGSVASSDSAPSAGCTSSSSPRGWILILIGLTILFVASVTARVTR